MNIVYVAVISKIGGVTQRYSYSEAINDLVDSCNREVYEISEGNFDRNTLMPATHVLRLWLDKIKEQGFWVSWMDDATDFSLYHLIVGVTVIS